VREKNAFLSPANNGIEEGKYFWKSIFQAVALQMLAGGLKKKKHRERNGSLHDDGAAQKEVSKNQFLCRSLLWWVKLLRVFSFTNPCLSTV
jgi:hypothetical protein